MCTIYVVKAKWELVVCPKGCSPGLRVTVPADIGRAWDTGKHLDLKLLSLLVMRGYGSEIEEEQPPLLH